MATVIHQKADKTVLTIADRNVISPKPDNMVVVVIDAIGDIDAGTGVATYRWNKQLNTWLMISKSGNNLNFTTEELVINGGQVNPSHVPSDNLIWGIVAIDGDTIMAEIRIEDITVAPDTITGLAAWDGLNLRFTYAYGTITQQIDSYIDQKFDELLGGVGPEGDTMAELYAIITATGTADEFDTGLV